MKFKEKKTRTKLSCEDELTIVNLYEQQNSSHKQICDEFKIDLRRLKGIFNRRQRIKNREPGSKLKSSGRRPFFKEFEEKIVYPWMGEFFKNGESKPKTPSVGEIRKFIKREILKAKGHQYDIEALKSSKLSNGYIEKLKKRFLNYSKNHPITTPTNDLIFEGSPLTMTPTNSQIFISEDSMSYMEECSTSPCLRKPPDSDSGSDYTNPKFKLNLLSPYDEPI